VKQRFINVRSADLYVRLRSLLRSAISMRFRAALLLATEAERLRTIQHFTHEPYDEAERRFQGLI